MNAGRRSREKRSDQVAGTLRLRRWALEVLTWSAGRTVPSWNDTSLELFLESERCAIQLKSRLVETGLRASAPHEVRNRIAQRSSEETARVRSAREHLAVVGEIASEHGWHVAALKGSVVAVAEDHAIDLVDVDLLADPEEARQLAAELDRKGYRPVGHSSPRHLTARIKNDSIPIEIHTTLSRAGAPLPGELWDRLEPLETVPGICRLGWRDHLWHLLEHMVIDHPERRGFIRELMLIGQAIAECGENDLTAVNRRIDGCSHRRALREVFEAADHLRKGRCDNVPLESVAAAFYSVRVVLQPVLLPLFLEGYVYKWAFGWLMGRAARRSLWDEIWFTSLDRSTNPPVAWLERWARPVARPFRLSLRLARALIAAAIAFPVAVMARRITRHATATVSAHDTGHGPQPESSVYLD